MGESRQKSAELHQTPEHTHGGAAQHHGQEDHPTGHEQSRQDLEHSNRIMSKQTPAQDASTGAHELSQPHAGEALDHSKKAASTLAHHVASAENLVGTE